MKHKLLGIIIIIVVIGVAVAYVFIAREGLPSLGNLAPKKLVTVSGLIGSEKSNFLEDPALVRRLRLNHGLKIDFRKAGSIEMVRTDMGAGSDFLWPSSQLALELYKEGGNKPKREGLIFSSPLVYYAWDEVAAALESKGMIQETDGVLYLRRHKELFDLILAPTEWSALGLDFYGKISLISTDPNLSNSGMLFAGLAANVISGDVIDSQALSAVAPRVKGLFARMGYLQHSTGILFEDEFLKKGAGQYPMIVGYENQIVEFSLKNPELWERVSHRIRSIYPVPTVWSSHAFIALTEKGERLLEALSDPVIQELAWKSHGFRSGLAVEAQDPAALGVQGIPATINQVIPMPKPLIALELLEALR